jgi:preprotein translocase subunit SecE
VGVQGFKGSGPLSSGPSAPERGKSMIERIKQFLREVKIEIKKVVYPSKDELVGSTWA